ncbi:Hypothetical protein CINCED_3A011709 [Cinara cedri]|uniref:Uncharacterized protein n=1 Tax=Cinara cedri TaxID=506608 RepID=A0A5E4M8M9_9HEMI|nr:Hypothetical protein CINCED_3A011709 [Cinara cedri]
MSDMLLILRIAELLIPIVISIWMVGLRSKNLIDFIKLIQVQTKESHSVFKLIFTQVSVYVSLFFTVLVLCGVLIKDQMPKTLIIIGSAVQVILSITSSYFLFVFYKDIGKYNLILCSSAFAMNGLLFTIDAIIMFQQIIFSRPR